MIIEKGIQIPPLQNKWKKMAEEMKHGDSVLVPTQANRQSLRFALKSVKKTSTSRRVENGFFRIWCIIKEKS